MFGEWVDGVSAPQVVLLGYAGAAHQAVQRGVSLEASQLGEADLPQLMNRVFWLIRYTGEKKGLLKAVLRRRWRKF